MSTVATGIDVRVSDGVRAALDRLGRTEDLRFSPDNRTLAIAGFGRSRILLLRVTISGAVAGSGYAPTVEAGDFVEIASTGLRNPHGIDFYDNETLIAANRRGGVTFIPLPTELGARSIDVAPLGWLGDWLSGIKTPGSVAVVHGGQRSGERSAVLVCNNYTHRVTRHEVGRAGGRAVRSQVLLRRDLVIPDGISLSDDGQWAAISSHGTHDIKLFALDGPLSPRTIPAGVLREANYPHGLRFVSGDRYLIAADAGSPFVNVYERGDSWAGERLPARTVRVLDDAAFLRGRTNPEEGGPKGIDIDRSGQVVAVTCEEQPLAFFPASAFVGG